MKYVFCLLTAAFLMPGCGLQEKEQALKKKEVELNQKEQELILREKTLQFKEEEVAQKERRLDTLAKDSAFMFHPNLSGIWSTKMTCVETTCTGSAVGDVKIEKWTFSYEGNHIIARVISDNKLVRVYTGAFNANTLELTQFTEATPTSPATRMNVRLMVKDDTHLEGQREIVRENECRITYAVQIEKDKA